MNNILQAYYKSAHDLQLPVTYIDEINGLHIRFGHKSYFLINNVTQLNNASSIYISDNKRITKLLLQDKKIPVPNGVIISKDRFLKHPLSELMGHIAFPVVVRTLRHSMKDTEVFCNIKHIDDLSCYLKKRFRQYTYLLVEEYQSGLKEYQILLLNKRIISIVERIAPTVTGDGEHTIKQLMTRQYKQGKDNLSHSFMEFNEDCISCLADQKLNPDSIPENEQLVKFRHVVHHELGGKSLAINKHINRENAAIIKNIVTITGLDLAGIDLLCEDINKPFSNSRWFVLQANHSPDITLHERTHKETVSKKILTQLIYRHPFAYIWHRLKRLSHLPIRVHAS